VLSDPLADDWEADRLRDGCAKRVRDLLHALEAHAGIIVRLRSLNLLLGDGEALGKSLLGYAGGDPRLDDRLGQLVKRAEGPLLHAAGAQALVRPELVFQHLRFAAESVACRRLNSRVDIGRRIAPVVQGDRRLKLLQAPLACGKSRSSVGWGR
jgi:hypothetical protein